MPVHVAVYSWRQEVESCVFCHSLPFPFEAGSPLPPPRLFLVLPGSVIFILSLMITEYVTFTYEVCVSFLTLGLGHAELICTDVY